MTLTVTHPFHSPVADDPAATAAGEVTPSRWNAAHTISGTLPAANVAAAGSDTQVQFNNSGVLGASANLFWNGAELMGTSFISREDAPFNGGYFSINDGPTSYLGAFTTPWGWFGGAASTTDIAIVARNKIQFYPTASITSVLDITSTNVASTIPISTPLLALPDTTSSSSGVLTLNSIPFLHAAPGTASINTFVGGAGNFTLTGVVNVGIGKDCLKTITSGGFNIAVGAQAASLITSGTSNLAIGFNTLYNCGAANSNIAIGNSALFNNPAGGLNTALGLNAGKGDSATTGSANQNVWIGISSGLRADTCTNCLGFGFQSLEHCTGGARNTAIGNESGGDVTNGADNIFIGNNSGLGIMTGARNVIIGPITGLANGLSDTIIFGDGGGTVRADYNYTTTSPATWTFAARIAVPGGTTPVLTTTAAVTSGAGALVGTLTNSPVTGNPTKWIPFNDNGVTRYIPAW